MSFDLAAIRADLVEVLEQIDGFEVYASLKANHDPPCLMVGVPLEIEYHTSVDGGPGPVQRVDIPVRVAVNGADPDEAMSQLDTALSYGVTGSVPDVIESAGSTAWSAVQVLGVTEPIQIGQGDAEIASADIIVRVYTV